MRKSKRFAQEVIALVVFFAFIISATLAAIILVANPFLDWFGQVAPDPPGALGVLVFVVGIAIYMTIILLPSFTSVAWVIARD